MPNYILRDLPQTTWDRFKSRSQRDRWHLRALFMQLMDDYGAGRIHPTKAPEGTPSIGTFELTCPSGHKFGAHFTKRSVLDFMVRRNHVSCLYCGVGFLMPEDDYETLLSWAHTRDLGEPRWQACPMPTKADDVVISRREHPRIGYWVWPVIRDGQQREDNLPSLACENEEQARDRARSMAAEYGGSVYFHDDRHDQWTLLESP